MEMNQKATGTTLRPARSLAIHCTTKRIAKTIWATRPNSTQRSNFATKTS